MKDPSDLFAEFAEIGKSEAQLRYELRKAERAKRRAEKAKAEKEILLILWNKEHKKKIAALLEKYPGARELLTLLENLTPHDSRRLLDTVKAGPWRDTDDETRFIILNLIDHAIAFMREKQGLPPFNDAIDDKLTVFQLIKYYLDNESD